MPSVDERVVSLKLNSEEFQNKVKSTIQSLNELKASLNSKSGSGSFDSISSAVNNTSFDPITSGIDTVHAKFSMLQMIGASVINNITTDIVNAGKRILTAIPNQIKTGGWTRATNIAQAKFQIEGLGRSWDEVKDSINEAVSGTAYGLDESAKVASQLLASNVQTGDAMTKSLRAVSGVAAMTGSSYEDIGRIFTTVAGNGRLMGDQLLQLSGRGLNAAAKLAEAMGVTEAEVRDMVSKGQIDFQTFANAMDDAFGAHAKDANKTFQGAFSNVKAALSRIGADFATPIQEAMIPVFQKLIPLINNVKSALQPLVQDFTNFSQLLSGKVSGILEKVSNYIKPDHFIQADAWSKFVKDYTGDLKVFQNALVETATKDNAELKNLIDSSESFEASLSNGWLTADVMTNTLDRLGKEAQETGTDVKKLANYMDELERMAQTVIRGDWGNGQERYDRLTEAGWSYHDVQSVVNRDLLGWEVTLEKASEEQLKAKKYTDEQIKSIMALREEAEKTGTPINELIKSMEDPAQMNTLELIIASFRNVVAAVTQAVKVIKEAFSESFDFSNLGDPLHKAAEMLYNFTSALTMTENEANVAKGIIKGFFSAIKLAINVFKAALTVTIAIAKAVWNVTEPFIDIIIALVYNIANATSEVLSNSKAWEIFNGVIQSVSGFVTRAGDMIGNAAFIISRSVYRIFESSNIFGKIKTKFSQFSTQAAPIFKKIGEVALIGLGVILDMATKLATSLPGLLAKVKNALAPIGSAFKNAFNVSFGNLDIIGMLENLGGSIKKFGESIHNKEGFIKSFFELLGDIGKKAGDGLKTVIEFFKTFFGGVSVEADKGAENVKSGLDNFQNQIGNFTSGVNDKLNALGDNQLLNSATSVVGALVGIVTDLVNILKTATGYISELDGQALADTFSAIFAAGTMVAMFKYVKGFQDFTKVLKDIKDFKIGPFETISKSIDGFTKALKPSKIIEVSVCIAILAGSIKLLSTIPTGQLLVSGAAILGCAIFLMGAMVILEQLAKKADPESIGKMDQLAVVMLVFAGSILAMSLALKYLSGMKWGEFASGMGKLALMMAALAGSMALIGIAAKGGFKSAAPTIIAFSIAMFLLVGAIKLLGNMNIGEIEQGMTVLLTLMMSFAGIMNLVGKAASENLAQAAPVILAFVFAVGALVAVLWLLGNMDSDKLSQGLQGLYGVLLSLTFAIGVLLLAVGLLSGAFPGFATALSSLAPVIAAVGLAALGVGASIFLVASGLKVISDVCNSGNLGKSAAVLAGLAVGLLVMVGVLVVAAGAFSVAAPVILALGAAMLMIAASVAIFAGGLALLTAVALPAAGALQMIILSLAETLPVLARAIGDSMGPLLEGAGKSLSDAAPAIGESVASLVGTLLEKLGTLGSSIVNALITMLSGIANTLASRKAELFQAIVTLVQTLGEGFVTTVPTLVNTALSAITAFISALGNGIRSHAMEMRQAAGDLVSGLIDGIYTFITGKEAPMNAEGKTLGQAIVDGVGEGISSAVDSVISSIGSFATSIIDKFKGILGINSPSKVFEEAGNDTMEGYKQGLENGKDGPLSSLASFCDSIIEKISSLDLVQKGGEFMSKIGEGIKSFASHPIESIGNVVTNIGSTVGNFASGFVQKGSTLINNLGNGIRSGVGFVTNGVSAVVSGAKTAVNSATGSFRGYGTNMASGLGSGLRGGSGAVSAAGGTVVQSGVSAIQRSVSLFGTAGRLGITMYVNGIRSGSGSASSAGSAVASKASSGLRSGSSGGYSAGANLGQGYVNGINSKYSSAYNAGYRVGQAGAKGINDGQKSHSPSRLAMQSGKYLGAGYVIGVNSTLSAVREAGVDMAETGLEAIGNTIDAISSLIDDSINVDPVITPILDVSTFNRSVGSIADSFGDYSIGLSAMASNSFVGTSSPVDSLMGVIDDLRSSISGSGDTVYNITVDGATINDTAAMRNAFTNMLTELQRKGGMNRG